MPVGSPADFVRDHTELTTVGFVPEIRLHLALGSSLDLWEATTEARGIDGIDPPFWAFPWAGGLALARYLLDHPELVTGRDVVDLACGSGLVAIAAATAGARVRAYDIDPLAVIATRRNAAVNGVVLSASVADVQQFVATPGALVLAGDVFYERSMAESFLAALQRAVAVGADVLIGDPYRQFLPRHSLIEVAEYDVDVDAELESTPVKRCVIATLRTQ